MSLPVEVLAQVVRHHVGRDVEMWLHDRDPNSPMNAVLDAAAEVMAHPVAVFWVDGGIPENYSLPGLEPAVIVFNSRYLELIGTLRGLITTSVLAGELMQGASERASLRILAELTLRYGDPALACHLFTASLLDEGIHTPQVTLMEAEMTPISEMYMVMWFFALLHELGHVHWRDRPADGVPDSLPYLEELIAEVVRQIFPAGQAPAASLSYGPLIEELDADLFAVQVLFAATPRVLRTSGREFSGLALAAEILLIYQLFYYMNSCGLAARIAAGQKVSQPVDEPGLNIANMVRLNAILDFVVHLLGGGDEIRRLLLQHMDFQGETATAFDRGHTRAMREAMFAAEARLDVLGGLVEHVESSNFSATFVSMEARRFVTLASAMGVRHRDIDLLAAIAERPGEARRLLREQQSAYLLAWIRGPQVDQPVVLSGRDGKFVFVFADQDSFDIFVDETRRLIEPGLELARTAIVSPTEHNVRIAVHRQLPQTNERLHVVFEGSQEFRRRMETLADGTFWAARRHRG